MELECSLWFSQEPTTGPYPKFDDFYKIHSNITLTSTLISSKWSLAFRFSDQNFVCISSSVRVLITLIVFREVYKL